MKRVCCTLLLLLTIVACDEEIFVEYPPQLVVEGWIDDGGFPVVILSESLPVSQKYADVAMLDEKVVKWAKVTVSDGENEVVLTGKSNKSYFPPYIYTTSHMRGVAGGTYKLTVSYDDYYAEAETTVPEKVSVERFISENCDGYYNLKAVINDVPDERNYYKFFVRVIGKDSMYLSSNMSVIDDRNFEFPLEVSLSPGKSIFDDDDGCLLDGSERLLVKFAQVDSVAYWFWDEYKNHMEVKQNSIFRYTGNACSNIKGGLGYWIGYGATEYLCEPYMHDTPIVIN